MKRKRITQLFPFLLPIRRMQRKLFFYLRMRFDANSYARTRTDRRLPFCAYEAKTNLINPNTGFDITYQHNKVFNLKLAAGTINGVLITPGDTFSFWQLVRKAQKQVCYKEGLSVENGELKTVKGGGLCHLSNFLFWMFLHSPLEIVERHSHRVKDFPSPDANAPDGVDAAVSEGWLDLKIRNQTDQTFQIDLVFDDTHLYGRILTERDWPCRYEIANRDKLFFKRQGKIYEQVSVVRQGVDKQTGNMAQEQMLYTDVFEVGYTLPEGLLIKESLI